MISMNRKSQMVKSLLDIIGESGKLTKYLQMRYNHKQIKNEKNTKSY